MNLAAPVKLPPPPASSIIMLSRAVFLCAAAVLCGHSGISAADLREKNRAVAEKCRMAMEFYYKGDYSSAIRNWEDALTIDPEQSSPRRLIEEARKKIEEKLGPLSEEAAKLTSDGLYEEALKKNAELLTLDPTNPRHRAVSAKISKIAAAAKSITAKSRAADVLRRSVYVYAYREANVRHAILGARYAAHLEPSDPTAKKIKEILERDYPQAAQFEKEMPGVDILESKLMSALDNIYDGRYDKAIADCNDALFLDPSNVMARKRLGSAHWALGDKNKAREAWRAASRFAPNDAELKKFLQLK